MVRKPTSVAQGSYGTSRSGKQLLCAPGVAVLAPRPHEGDHLERRIHVDADQPRRFASQDGSARHVRIARLAAAAERAPGTVVTLG